MMIHAEGTTATFVAAREAQGLIGRTFEISAQSQPDESRRTQPRVIADGATYRVERGLPQCATTAPCGSDEP